MRRKGISLIVCFLQLLYGFSQRIGGGTATISVGPSMPVGSYGGSNFAHRPASFAKTGFVASLAYYTPPKTHFGFAADLRIQSNPLDVKKLEQAAEHNVSGPVIIVGPGFPNPPPPGSTKTYPNWQFAKHSWLAASLLVGGYAEFPTGNRSLFFMTKATAGITYATCPKVKGQSVTDTSFVAYEQKSKSGTGFAYAISTGLRFVATKRMSLFSNVEYFGTSSIRFKKVQTIVGVTEGSPGSLPPTSTSLSMQTSDGHQGITAVNVVLGIAFRL